MISLLSTVDIRNIQPEINLAIQVAHEIYQMYGCDLVITSVVDGQHMQGSLHPKGFAVDLRLPDMYGTMPVVMDLTDALGDQFDIIAEVDHIHIEFDPK